MAKNSGGKKFRSEWQGTMRGKVMARSLASVRLASVRLANLNSAATAKSSVFSICSQPRYFYLPFSIGISHAHVDAMSMPCRCHVDAMSMHREPVQRTRRNNLFSCTRNSVVAVFILSMFERYCIRFSLALICNNSHWSFSRFETLNGLAQVDRHKEE